jgi:predicted Rossmann-fold nucleotide-binding protein
VAFLDHAVEQGFVRREHRERICVAADPDRLLELLRRQAASPKPME